MKIALLCLLLTVACFGLEVKITDVHDGDTVTCTTNDGAKITVRLYGIDAYELEQEGGATARFQLIAILDQFKTCDLITVTTDRYKRVVGILIGKSSIYPYMDINAYMLLTGYAWYYPDTKPVSNNYKFLYEYSKENHRGLWLFHKDNVIPPWEWRKQKNKE